MWQWAAVMTLAIGSALGSAHSQARAVVSLAPDCYAQQQWCASTAPTKVWSSSVRAGKSWAAWMDALRKCAAIPGYPVAYTRFEFASMRESSLQTLARMLGPDLFGQWWSESKHTLFLPPVRCDDGKTRQSRIVCFGWLDPGRALSTEYGLIIMEQAEQMQREHVAYAHTRLNFHDPWQEQHAQALGINARQLGIVCNADDPEHWLNLDYLIEERGMRVEPDPETGAVAYEVILSQADDWERHTTADYRARQHSALGGTIWHDRLIGGRWVRAEGLVYGQVWNPAIHIIQRPEEWDAWGGYPPPSWPRHRAMDFGVNHPFTCAWYAERPDRRLICYREVYGTGRAPSLWAEEILRHERDELEAWRAACPAEQAQAMAPYLAAFECASSISDTDLGWRTELGRGGVWTDVIDKDILGQIAVMTSALREVQIQYVSDLLVEPDPRLVREKLPTSVLQEFGRYKWRKRPAQGTESGDARFDVPVDRDDHGLNRDAYLLTHYRGAPQLGVW